MRRDGVSRHVQLADYDKLREALLWTLERIVGEDTHVCEVWTVCCDELAGELKRRPMSDCDL